MQNLAVGWEWRDFDFDNDSLSSAFSLQNGFPSDTGRLGERSPFPVPRVVCVTRAQSGCGAIQP
jgi:hypothetical protein